METKEQPTAEQLSAVDKLTDAFMASIKGMGVDKTIMVTLGLVSGVAGKMAKNPAEASLLGLSLGLKVNSLTNDAYEHFQKTAAREAPRPPAEGAVKPEPQPEPAA